MIRTATLTAVTAAVLLSSAPLVGAEWFSYGSYEPDTSWDTSDLMWDEPPVAGQKRVYFNAYPKWGDGGSNGGFTNVNVGAAHTRFDPAGPTSYLAILGLWTDCNGDGYVGMVETAVREYKAELLDAAGLQRCPPKSGAVGSGAAYIAAGYPHNYNGWVTELIPIGGRDYTPTDDTRVFADRDAMVWGDLRHPDADAAPADDACPNFPLPGDAHTTGGFIRTLDCRGNRGVVNNFNTVDSTAGTGLGFQDSPTDPGQSSSPLNVDTFGDDDSQYSAVYLADCNGEPIANTGNTPVNNLDNVDVAYPVPSNPVNGRPPTEWTVAGTVNATREGITAIPEGNASREPGSDSAGNCDTSDDAGNDFYGNIEANAAINQGGGKRNAQWNFFFNTATRGSLPATALAAGRTGAATDFGVEALGIECGASSCTQSAWRSPGADTLYTPPVTRGNVQDGSIDGDETTIADAPYWSFYAYVSGATTSRGLVLPGGGGVYGAAQCGSYTSGEHHGWNCDPDEWYLLADGTNTQDTTIRPLAKVGQAYNLRDVDCYDGSIQGTGVGISPAFFGTPCA